MERKWPMQTLTKSVPMIIMVICIFIVSACGGNTEPPPTDTPTPIPTETPTPMPTSTPAPVIRVVPSGTHLEPTELYVEVHQQDNCGVPTTTISTFSNSATIHYNVELGASMTVNAEGEISLPGFTKVGIGAALAAHYNVQYGGQETKTFTLQLQAPGDVRVDHTLRHLQLWDRGTIIVTILGKDTSFPYKFPREYRIENKSIELPCPTTPVPTTIPMGAVQPTLPLRSTDTPVATATLIPTPTATPLPTKPISSATTTVKREDVEAWTVGEVSSEQVTVCLGQVHEGPRPFQSFAAGEQIPAGVLVATNYGEAGRDWHEFPIQAVCHFGSWGLFETTATYTAPYEGAYWTIIARPATVSGSPVLCVPDGVRGHETANPLYQLPPGHSSGWITSDPSDLILPDGSMTTIIERYVLLVSDVAEVQIQNVAVGSKHSNTWGCWFRDDLADQVLPAAEEELRKMEIDAPTVAAGLYRLDGHGLTKLKDSNP